MNEAKIAVFFVLILSLGFTYLVLALWSTNRQQIKMMSQFWGTDHRLLKEARQDKARAMFLLVLSILWDLLLVVTLIWG